jgi:hypothetical protein
VSIEWKRWALPPLAWPCCQAPGASSIALSKLSHRCGLLLLLRAAGSSSPELSYRWCRLPLLLPLLAPACPALAGALPPRAAVGSSCSALL